MNTNEEDSNCTVCYEAFDENVHSPRTLRCGHTICTPCIDELLKKSVSHRLCPECRKVLKVTDSSHLPVSYTILRLSRALAKTTPKVQIQVVDNNTCMQHGAPTISWCPSSDKWHCFKCVHEDNCEDLLSVPEAFLHIKQNYSLSIDSKVSELDGHIEFLENECGNIQREIASLQIRTKELKKDLERGNEWQKRLDLDEALLVEASSTSRMMKSIKRLKGHVAECDSWMKKSKEYVGDHIAAGLSNISSSLDISSLADKLRILNVAYFVHENDKFEGKRWGKLVVDNKYLIMHSLEDKTPPDNAVIIKFKDAIDALSGESLAFFEICKDDKYEGRVYMEMFGQTPRAKQFLKLCTGEDGISYKDFALLDSCDKRHQFLRTGNKIKRAPLVEGVTNGGEYSKVVSPGMLLGSRNYGSLCAQCDIVLKCYSRFEHDCAFGMVVEGLSLLYGVSESNNAVRPVISITNCGIVIHKLY